MFDFDEIYSHFTDNVEFPISQIFKDRADPKQVHDYESYYHIQIRTNQLEMGDIIDARGSHGFENRPINTSKVVDTRGGDYVEGDIDKRQNTQSIKDTHSSPWSSGSFYLVIFLMIIIALAVIGHILPWYTFPIVIIGGLLALSVVGAFQLRQDNRLSEESFLKLMALSFKYIPWLRGSNTGNVQDALPETSNSSHKSSK